MAYDQFQPELTITATEFKAKCLQILDHLTSRKLERVTITKRGKPVGVLTAPVADIGGFAEIFGCMKGEMVIPAGFDFNAPAIEEPFDAELGVWERR